MKNVMTYCEPGCTPQAAAFIDGLESKLREKVIRQIVALSHTPRTGLKEPHYKHFSIEKYQSLYELREKGKVMIRIIFTVRPGGQILLLHAFVKRQRRDTMQALEQSLRLLAELRKHPERAVEYKVKEESP